MISYAKEVTAFEGGTVYKYHESHKECQLWIQSLPNQSKSLKITHNTHICYKPFPLDCPKKKIPGDALILTVVPSIFGETNSDYVMQSATSTRKLLNLNVILLWNLEHKFKSTWWLSFGYDCFLRYS